MEQILVISQFILQYDEQKYDYILIIAMRFTTGWRLQCLHYPRTQSYACVISRTTNRKPSRNNAQYDKGS